MQKKKSKLKNILLCTGASAALQSLTPIVYAETSVQIIVRLINELLTVFTGAGVLLLLYAIIALILAMKDENAESKVNAISQLGVAIVLITFSTILSQLAQSVGVTGIN